VDPTRDDTTGRASRTVPASTGNQNHGPDIALDPLHDDTGEMRKKFIRTL